MKCPAYKAIIVLMVVPSCHFLETLKISLNDRKAIAIFWMQKGMTFLIFVNRVHAVPVLDPGTSGCSGFLRIKIHTLAIFWNIAIQNNVNSILR